jgi:hypothetical protein
MCMRVSGVMVLVKEFPGDWWSGIACYGLPH